LDYNQVFFIDDKKTTTSGWKKKEKIVKFIKKEIENKMK